MKRVVLLASIALASFAGTAAAATINLDTISRGAYASNGTFGTVGSGSANGNYLTGQFFVDLGMGQLFGDSDIRSFFVYSLPSIATPITSASISFGLSPSNQCAPAATCGYFSSDPSETLSLVDFSASLSDLLALITGTGGVAAWADLGTGVEFANRIFTAADSGVVTITLNAAAVAALNAARTSSGLIAIGGHLTTISGPANQAVFGDSQNRLARLNLETADAAVVPEPASIFLLGAGLAGAARSLRRRRR